MLRAKSRQDFFSGRAHVASLEEEIIEAEKSPDADVVWFSELKLLAKFFDCGIESVTNHHRDGDASSERNFLEHFRLLRSDVEGKFGLLALDHRRRLSLIFCIDASGQTWTDV